MELVPLAESVVKLTAICMNCRSDAAFSRRLGCEKEIELIGKEDKYMSVCRECYHKTHIQSPHKAAQGIKRPMENVGVTIDPKESYRLKIKMLSHNSFLPKSSIAQFVPLVLY